MHELTHVAPEVETLAHACEQHWEALVHDAPRAPHLPPPSSGGGPVSGQH
jgi:hypothetical protein